MSNNVIVKNTARVAKRAAVEGHEGMEFLDDNLRMVEQPLQTREFTPGKVVAPDNWLTKKSKRVEESDI